MMEKKEEIDLLFITESEITLVQMCFKKKNLCLKEMLSLVINIFHQNESLLSSVKSAL